MYGRKTDKEKFAGAVFSEKVQNKFVKETYGTQYPQLKPGSATATGLKYWIQSQNDPENKFAYIQAAAGTGNTKVLWTPYLWQSAEAD